MSNKTTSNDKLINSMKSILDLISNNLSPEGQQKAQEIKGRLTDLENKRKVSQQTENETIIKN